MRIAYHNPWKNASESQNAMSMVAAGQAIGVEVVPCADEHDIEACRPDFVLCVSGGLAKVTDIPTYLTVHVPSEIMLGNGVCFRNLFSFDGYLTISDSLARVIRDVTFGVGRYESEPGFCYLTPQRSTLAFDWGRADLAEVLRVVYFGTNWTRRMPELFRALDPLGLLLIHGPEASWQRENYRSYAGGVPFDGIGPQRIYAERGIGLAIMDEQWWREDVISSRVFEISAVGAVSICPDMPWTRRWFGDSVLYFDPLAPVGEMVAAIAAHVAFCRDRPEAARAMAERARAIFETRFSAERMLHNAIAYHERKVVEHRARVEAMAPCPGVTVVIRCGGRSLEVLERAVDSVRRQTFGRLTVLFARYRDIDLSPITSRPGGAIEQFDGFLIEGGGRTRMLWEGIRRVATPYFAVLDDDDFWMSDHLETVFAAGRRVAPDFDMAFAAQLGFDHRVEHWPGLVTTRSIHRFGYETDPTDSVSLLNWIGINSFVARRDLLTDEMLHLPDMRTAEDSLLICLLAWRSKPIFSYRPTAFYRVAAEDGSHWETDPQRFADETSLALRAGLAYAPAWLPVGSLATPLRMLEVARARRARLAGAAEAGVPAVARADVAALEARLRGIETSTSWRITAPLRWVSERLRRLRRGTG